MSAEVEMINRKSVPVLYLDLDGTVRKGFDELGRFVNGPDDVELFPRMRERLLSYKQQGWRIVGVSNQGGVALGHLTLETMNDAAMRTVALTDFAFDLMYACTHHPEAKDPEMANCFCRKPKMGMLVMAQMALGVMFGSEIYPPHLALMVGDRPEDEQCASSAGVRFMWAEEWRQLPFTIEVRDEHQPSMSSP